MAISSEMGSYLSIPVDWTYKDVLNDFNQVYDKSMNDLDQNNHLQVSKAFKFFFEFDSRLKHLLEEISKGNHSEPVSMETENQLLTLQGNLAFYQLELFGKITEYLEEFFFIQKEKTVINQRKAHYNTFFKRLGIEFQTLL